MSYKLEADEQERKLYVGGLNKETDEDELRRYFDKHGSIIDLNIMRDPERRSRGFAFILFEDAATVDSIMVSKKEDKEFVLSGSTLHIKRALPKVQGGKAVVRNTEFRKVFVGGLPSSITEEDLQNHFDRFGRVTEVELLRDRDTNRLRGFAFITFEDEDTADRCIQRRTHEICKKVCEVKRASTKVNQDRQAGYDNRELKQMPNGNSGAPSAGIIPMDEVNRLIQQAFVMGQQSVQAPAPMAPILPAPPADNNLLLQALLGQQTNQVPSPVVPTPAPVALSVPSVPAPTSGVMQIAQLLQNSGVDAKSLAALLKRETQKPAESTPPSYSTSYPPVSSYNHNYERKTNSFGLSKDDGNYRFNPY